MSEEHPRADLRGPCGERVPVTQRRPPQLISRTTAMRTNRSSDQNTQMT